MIHSTAPRLPCPPDLIDDFLLEPENSVGKAAESLPAPVGVESWRDLDRMCDLEKVRMDVSQHDALAQCFNRIFESQIEGAKIYDVAVHERWAANAIFFDPRQADQAAQVILGMNLTPRIQRDPLDVVDFTCGFIRRFDHDVRSELQSFFPESYHMTHTISRNRTNEALIL